MKLRMFSCVALGCCANAIAVQAYAQTASGVPHLEKQGIATQLIVDGKPFLALTGELGNNTASSLENMQPIWSRLVAGNLNCVLAAVSWAQMEPRGRPLRFRAGRRPHPGGPAQQPEAGVPVVRELEERSSSYAPLWVKQDYKRFPRVKIKGGKSIELLSTFSDASRDADARAYRALMRHIKEADGQKHTVLMIQVENEVGVLRDSRDRSEPANKAFAGPVPKELMDYLRKHQDALAPELREVWSANGSKTSGTWKEVFGPASPTASICRSRRTVLRWPGGVQDGMAEAALAGGRDLYGLAIRPLCRQGGGRGQSGIQHPNVRERLAAAT